MGIMQSVGKRRDNRLIRPVNLLYGLKKDMIIPKNP